MVLPYLFNLSSPILVCTIKIHQHDAIAFKQNDLLPPKLKYNTFPLPQVKQIITETRRKTIFNLRCLPSFINNVN
jgi:hypothetical protein